MWVVLVRGRGSSLVVKQRRRRPSSLLTLFRLLEIVTIDLIIDIKESNKSINKHS